MSTEARTPEAQRALNVRNAVTKLNTLRQALSEVDEVLRFSLDHAETGHSDIAGCLNGLHSFVKGEVARRRAWLEAIDAHGAGDREQTERDLGTAQSALGDIETLRGVGFRFRS